jgi:hypothetical protein
VYGAETWTLRKVGHKDLASLKFGAGEGWRRSVGPIKRKIKKCYKELERRRISYKP